MELIFGESGNPEHEGKPAIDFGSPGNSKERNRHGGTAPIESSKGSATDVHKWSPRAALLELGIAAAVGK